MSELEKLKAASSLSGVAHILRFTPRGLAYILYKKPITEKYKHFEIPKRSGGKRLISAPHPDLMHLQKQLSNHLQKCIDEINEARKIKSTLSHGFRPMYSIITNAATHRNKRYVFNLDLENFFGTINFGRVRGFFIKNRNFELNPAVATVLAQIACHDNVLPQGSPCSPVISNLIGHILDIRLAELAYKVGCSYSRYADDLTFSTNKHNFPIKVAQPVAEDLHQWKAGKDIQQIIEKAGFSINNAKTRMQYKESRQDVTGLVVNAKVNTRAEYRHTARAMVHRLLKTGSFQRKHTSHDDSGKFIVTEVEGTLEHLNGMLSFIDSVGVSNKIKDLTPLDIKKNLIKLDWGKNPKPFEKPDRNEKVYRRFLLFKNFFSSPNPLIVCEGKTDNIYMKAAIRRLVDAYPLLAEKKKDGISLKVIFFRCTNTTARVLGLSGLSGGEGNLANFIKEYVRECEHIAAPRRPQPVIVLIDNDSGAESICRAVKHLAEGGFERTAPFIFLGENLYIVLTPLASGGRDKVKSGVRRF